MKELPGIDVGTVINGYVVIGPVVRRAGHKLYPVRCLTCQDETLKYSPNLRSGKYGCRRCYHNSRIKSEATLGARTAIRTYRYHAKEAGRSFDLSVDEFQNIILQPCVYCGREETNAITLPNGDVFRYNGVDRIDSSMGYNMGNVMPCCWDCNRMKGDLSTEQFLSHIWRILSHTQSVTTFDLEDDEDTWKVQELYSEVKL